MIFADLLFLHLVTFFIFFILVYQGRLSQRNSFAISELHEPIHNVPTVS